MAYDVCVVPGQIAFFVPKQQLTTTPGKTAMPLYMVIK